MTIISITKKRIMKAIKNEPASNLRNGDWVHSAPDFLRYQDDRSIKEVDCPVCAVGAVMRSVLDKNQAILFVGRAAAASMTGGQSAPDIDMKTEPVSPEGFKWTAFEMASQGFYMASISYLFEALCEMYKYENCCQRIPPLQMANIKRSVIAHIDRNFPYKIQIDIDGATPARDVSVAR